MSTAAQEQNESPRGAKVSAPKDAIAGKLDISVSRVELLRELTAAVSVSERKTTIPILSNLLLEATEGRLTITATDLDQSLRTSCLAKVKKPGVCTVPARKFFDYIKLLPEGEINISLMENYWVKIRAGRSNTKMVGMARGNFPVVPEFPVADVYRLPAAALGNMIAKTLFAISREESRYTLNGALLILNPNSMVMVSTDGHRLAHVENSSESFEDIKVSRKTVIPAKALAELSSLLDASEAETIEFAADDNVLYFRVGGRVLTSRKMSGSFPNYEAVIPKRGDNTNFVIVRASDLLVSVQRVAHFADVRTGSIKLRFEQNQLTISSSATDSGTSEDVIDTPYRGEVLVVAFNHSYLTDFLKSIGGAGEVRLAFKNGQSAGLIMPETDNSVEVVKHILMPMRIV